MLLGVILLVPGSSHATEDAEPPAESVPESRILDTIDGSRDYLSQKVVNFSKRIDHFFGDERYFQEHNKSVVRLYLNETIAQGRSPTFKFEGKAKLDLPAAQKRFHLVLESNPEKTTTGEVNKDQPVAPKGDAAPPPEKYAASVRYEKADENLWHFSSDAGIKLQFPLDPFVRTRGSYAIPIGQWRLKIAQTLFWFDTIGLGETTQLDMERVLSAPVLFRATSTATCMQSPQNCALQQNLSIFHTLNERSSLAYQASVIGTNKPKLEETAYVLLMRYRYRMYEEWVFVEISPQLHFPKTDDFKLNALLLFRLEMLIGGTR